MLSSWLEQELIELNEPYKSEHFSGDRHFIRQQQLQAETKRETPSPDVTLQFNTLLGVKSNYIMDEAKSLLNEWLQEGKSPRVSLDDQYNYADSWLEKAEKSEHFPSPSQVNHVKNMVSQSVPATNYGRVGDRNLAVALKARQQLAKERRLILEEKKHIRLMELEAKRNAKSKSASAGIMTRVEQRAFMENAQKIAAHEIQEIKKEKIIEAQIASKEAVLELKKAELLEKEHFIKEQQEHKKLSIYQEKMAIAYAKADQLKIAKDTQLKRKVITAWFDTISGTRQGEKILAIKNDWKRINQAWSIWKKITSSIIEKRELEILAYQMRQQQQNMVKATRHHRLVLISKAILGWKQFIQINRQEELIKIAHEKRALKMQQFLMQLQLKHETVDYDLIKPKKTESENQEKGLKLQDDRVKKAEHQVIQEPSTEHDSSPQIQVKKSNVKKIIPKKSDLKLVEAMKQRERDRMERKALLARQRQEKILEQQKREEEDQRLKEQLEREEKEKIIQERKRLEQETRLILERREIEKMALETKMEKAILHYQNNVMKKYGLSGFQRLVLLRRQSQKIAEACDKKRHLKYFLLKIKEKREKNEEMAKLFHNNLVLKHSCSQWSKAAQYQQEKYKVSYYIFADHAVKRLMKSWTDRLRVKQQANFEQERHKMAIAELHASKYVPKRYLYIWKRFVEQQKEDRWREFRKNRLRETAKEVLQTSLLEKGSYLAPSLDYADLDQ